MWAINNSPSDAMREGRTPQSLFVEMGFNPAIIGRWIYVMSCVSSLVTPELIYMTELSISLSYETQSLFLWRRRRSVCVRQQI
eukprot:SAG11_NODE_1091_length_5910_cov_4.332817_3_plen_83_part_00